ncbi:unnamed protein product [Arctia plantaginis]|uniref:Malate dehydrogenase 1B n=1 Tax=Arctia plantaginis TaxID=874455 RepID=A0A8S0ZWL4_ARCPL|nr:unnamed protein product [Arctia plantaginis]
MGFRIVVAGESQCVSFAECCLLADFLSQNLPDFCFDRVEIKVLDWQAWLRRINLKNKWHHVGSPLIWKEMLMAGSKPYYIGGAPQFLDYCYSYYKFDSLFGSDKFEELLKNSVQLKKKVAIERNLLKNAEINSPVKSSKKAIIVTISGAGNPISRCLLVGLLEMNVCFNSIAKIYIYDENCSEEFMLSLEKEYSFIENIYPGKVVKYVRKIGIALTCSDLLIVLDHVPFENHMVIGEWLYENKKNMDKLSQLINASGSRNMYIVFPNMGPACFNATYLRQIVTITKDHIIVVTSDLGLEILPIAEAITDVPSRNMFCPPVWGFVGINHLVDIRSTIQRYDIFQPYSRFTKVKQSTLKIGSLTPTLRYMEYLMYFDESLWVKVAETKKKYPKGQPWLSKSIAVLNLIKVWFFERNPNDIVNLGLHCNGSFGLKFDGIFSQPARLVNDEWVPASDFLLPKDSQINIYYLEEMAERIMKLQRTDLPPLVPYYPCYCKPKRIKKKNVW